MKWFLHRWAVVEHSPEGRQRQLCVSLGPTALAAVVGLRSAAPLAAVLASAGAPIPGSMGHQ